VRALRRGHTPGAFGVARSPTAMAFLAALVCSSCGGSASTLEPGGPVAARIEGLWWLILWIATVAFVVVVGFLLVAVVRSRRTGGRDQTPSPSGERFVILSGIVVPAVVLIAVFVVSLRDMNDLARAGQGSRLVVEVVAHDWWWEVRYPNGGVTANEIHVPVGEPVRVKLETADVIHSFWVPRLAGKVDNVTGRTNWMWLEADEPGRYRGQCAEFCGLQHAKMEFFVVARPASEFQAWLEDVAAPAAQPTGVAAVGQEVFLGTTCVGCHAIEGTEAGATVGPDLTHVAGRETLMAGAVANTRANLARVITDPQAIKPGAAMPPTDLDPEQLEALLDYLEGLR
jgi:cytochrome c oxidase subunit II